MEVRRYQPSDFPQISEWGKQYGAIYNESQFPKTGFIVDGIAAYFLYSTDSSVCFLENLIANRKSTPREKDKAIELIAQAILQEARDKKFTIAYATADIPQVIFRAIKHGATAKPHQVLLTKNLTNDPS